MCFTIMHMYKRIISWALSIADAMNGKIFISILLSMSLQGCGDDSSKATRSKAAEKIAREVYAMLVERQGLDQQERLVVQNQLVNAFKIAPREPWIYVAASRHLRANAYRGGGIFLYASYRKGELDQSTSYAEKAVQWGPEIGRAYIELARNRIIMKQYKTAWAHLEEAQKIDNDDYESWLLKAAIAQKAGNTSTALTFLKQAQSRVNHGYQQLDVNEVRLSLSVGEGNTVVQEQIFLEDIEAQPDNPYVYGRFAAFLMQQRQYRRAARYWQKAIDIRPYQTAREGLAVANREMGK